MEVSLEGFEHLLFAEVVDGVVAGGGAEAVAEGGVCDESCGGSDEGGLGCGIGWDGEAAGFVRWRLARHEAVDHRSRTSVVGLRASVVGHPSRVIEVVAACVFDVS